MGILINAITIGMEFGVRDNGYLHGCPMRGGGEGRKR